MASVDGLLTFFAGSSSNNEEETTIDVSALTTTAVATGDTVDLLASGRPLGRGKPLFVQVQLVEDATANVNVELWTSDSVVETTGTTLGDLSGTPLQVASVSFTDDNDAGQSRFIHLQDNAKQYIQLRLSGPTDTPQTGDDFDIRAWIDTARITSTGITEAPFVGHETYPQVTNQGSGTALPFGAEGA